MNTKSFFFAMLALMLCSSRVIAKVVTENQAAMIAERLINVQGKKLTRKHQIKAGTSDQSLYYIFTGTDGKGFVIIAADDVARPVLGYSTDAELTPNGELPIPMEQWLTSIGNQIRQAQENGIQQSADVAEQWRVSSMGNTVVKLQTAQWGQSAPFNNQCPYDQGERSDAGCVPMAYAILMKYYKYPQAGKGNTQAYVTDSEGISVASRNLEHTYDWDNMPLKYISGQYNTTQANNVARLVADIGAALQVNYSSNGTGGLEGRGELFSNFDYYPGTARIKDLYSAHAWDEMMREELDKGRPIIYSAINTEGGGHCFMLDGYTDDDYFSVNWGWTGSYNGFFTLDALTPGIRFYKSGHTAYLNTVPMPSSDADFVVQRNGQLYPTLTAAILDSSIDGTPTTINLLADVQQNSLTITAGKTITLNIGNHSIDMLSSFYNYGNFTVNGTEQSLITTHGNNSVVSNYDVVELKGGSYINECTAVDSTDYRRCIWTAEGSKTHISDVSFKAPWQVICSNGEMTIESGSFTCTGNSSVISNYNSTGTLTIHGGTFINNCSSISGNDYRRCLWTADNSKTIIEQASFNNKYGAQTLCFNGDATINGAEINNENGTYGCLAFSGAKVVIDDCKLSAKYLFYTGSDSQIICRGGLYSNVVTSEFLAEGCKCVQNTQAETREKYPYRVIDNSSPAINFADINVKKICVDNWDTDGDGELSEAEAAAVTYLGVVFKSQTSITSFNELQYFTGLTSLSPNAFNGCSSLTSIFIGNNVTSIGTCSFKGCSSLTKVIVPDIATWCNTSFADNYSNPLFYATHIFRDEKTEITELVIPDGVTSIQKYAFYNCSSLTSVLIPDNVTSIGDYAFLGCSSLNTIDIPNGVKSIGKSAFNRCTGMATVTLPNSVTSISDYAFSNCSGLTDVYCYAENVPSTSSNAFNSTSINSATLHVPENSIDKYKAASPWSGFGKFITIEDNSFEVEMNGQKYPTLAEAIDDAPTNGTPATINLLADIQAGWFNIQEGKTIILNIGDHSINLQKGFYNYGNLTIKGTEKSLITTQGNSHVFANYGKMEIRGGTYRNVCSTIDDTDYRRCVWTAEGSKTHISDVSFNAPGQVICSNGEMTIESGSFTGTGNSSVVRITKNSSMFTILGGTYTGTGNYSVISNYNSTGTLTIQGGTFINNCSSISGDDYRRCLWTAEGSKTHISDGFFKSSGQVICSNGEMTIESGTYSCTGNNDVISNYNSTGTLTIHGGTFINNCSSISGDDYRRCLWTADDSKTIIEQASFSNIYGAQTLCFNGDATINGAEIDNENGSFGILTGTDANVVIDDCKLSAATILYAHSGSQITCRGGIYSNIVTSEFLAEGCECVQNTQAETRKKYPYRVIGNSSPAIIFADANVKKICVDNWDTDGDGELSEAEAAAVTDLGDVFVRKSITSFNELRYFTGLTSIKGYVFEYCNDLTSITIPNSVTSIIGTAFAHCANLTSVTVEVGNPKYDSRNDCNAIIETATNTLIAGCKNTIIPNDVTSIGTWAFIYRTTLTSITIPNSVTSIDESAFHTCSGLTSVIIPNSVTKIGAFAFYNCSSLTSITIPESVKNIGGEAFKRSGLTSLIITGSMTYIESSAFTDLNEGLNVFCYAKDVPTISEYAFDTKQIDSYILHVPAGSINSYKATLPWNLFGTIVAIDDSSIINFADNNVKKICVDNWDTNGDGELSEAEAAEVKNLGLVFENKSDITSFDELEYFTGLTSINEKAFSHCSNLISISIPNNVTNIGNSAFYDCYSLTSLIIPESVTWIGSQAFDECQLLNVLIKCVTPPETAGKTFFSEQSFYHTTLYIPSGSWKSYAFDGSWYQFINIRETATTEEQLSMMQAYTLMDAGTFAYSVYDPVNDRISSINKYGIDENNPNHCWQVIEVDGECYLYNLGAKKFVTYSENSLVLTSDATAIEMRNGRDGIVLGEQDGSQWAFVNNDRMNVEDAIADVIFAIQGTSSSLQTDADIYDVDGRKINKARKGINIIRYSDGTSRKVLIK